MFPFISSICVISVDLAVAPAFDQRFPPCHGKGLLEAQCLLNLWTLGSKLFVPSLLISETFCNTSVFCCSPSWDYLYEHHLSNQTSPHVSTIPVGRGCVCEAQFARGLGRCGQVSFETNPCAGIPLSALNLSCLSWCFPSLGSRLQCMYHPNISTPRADQLQYCGSPDLLGGVPGVKVKRTMTLNFCWRSHPFSFPRWLLGFAKTTACVGGW